MSKDPKHDPAWAKAKKVCRLNQDDITKAKALGLKPKTLLKNHPSPQQKWKAPVKDWIRDLYEKRFGGGKQPTGPAKARAGAKPARPKPTTPAPVVKLADDERFLEEEDEDWESIFEDEGLPRIPIEALPAFYNADDPDWGHHRRSRRQSNLRWAAAALALAWKPLEAVEAVALFGSVAAAIQEGPTDELWEDPPDCTHCHDLDLAIWVKDARGEVLDQLSAAVTTTLDSLLQLERIAVGWDELDLHLLESSTDRFLGQLRPGHAGAGPRLEFTPGFVLDARAVSPPAAVFLFESAPRQTTSPGADGDVPF
jgi:hypothetical protein